ncbi:hypothetical protein [Halostella sp. PRR32]|uniref:hypothetical protein n=1 Tax=Halostella sp. PRR32 TaxID=3098147 RepID=UPI002B1DE2C1|nr:hypothetical protein [Halostella sp. PRR32]
MAKDHDDVREEKADVAEENDSLIDRRSYLKLTGAAAVTAGAATAAAGTGAAAETLHGIEFDRVVDAVDDLGLDPNGNGNVEGTLANKVQSGTLVRFPEGTYQFGGAYDMPDRVGFVGEGDVKFRPPNGFNNPLLDTGLRGSSDNLLVEGIDIDLRADNTTCSIRFVVDNRFHIEDMEILGRGMHSGSRTAYAFLAGVRNADGVGVIRNITAKKGSRIGKYKGGNGRVGIWGAVGQGTLKCQNLDFREFGNNGIYASRTKMKVQVEDSYFENNNVCGVRISGDGSYVENCEIVTDVDNYTGPRPISTGSFNPRGIIVEQAKMSQTSDWRIPAGAEVRNCDVWAKSSPLLQSVIEHGPQGRSLLIKNTRVRCDVDGTPAIRRDRPGNIPWRKDQDTPPEPHWTRMENVQVTGNANGGAAVQLMGGDGSEVRNSCIQQKGSNRTGVQILDANNCEIADTNINVSGQAVDLQSSSADTSNITNGDSCPAPNIENTTSGEYEDTPSGDDSEPFPGNVLTIYGDSGEANYEFAVSSDDLQKLTANGATTDDDDLIDGSTASGSVWGGKDSYGFEGDVSSFTIDNDATITLNGENVSADSLGTEDDSSSDDGDSTNADQHTLTIVGDAGEANYEFSVESNLEQTTANNATVDDSDAVDGTTASGYVWGGIDSYQFEGGVTSFTIDNDATLVLDGKEVTPDDLGSSGSDDGASNPERSLIIYGDSGKANYEFSVSGELAPSDDQWGINSSGGDQIDGSSASGYVWGGIDSFAFSGDITSFDIDSDATVIVDGEEVDPAELGATGSSLPNTITVDAGDAEATYQFSMTGTIEKSTANGATIDDGDTVESGTASGIVEPGKKDSYAFDGSVKTFYIDGNASVDFEGEQ